MACWIAWVANYAEEEKETQLPRLVEETQGQFEGN